MSTEERYPVTVEIWQNMLSADNVLETAKSKAYSIKDYSLVDKIQEVMEAIYQIRRELEKEHEEQAARRLFNQLKPPNQ